MRGKKKTKITLSNTGTIAASLWFSTMKTKKTTTYTV